jgi:phosphoribosylaminoimidazolecarboxamide formyltransferase / IMP cyclohydrolase
MRALVSVSDKTGIVPFVKELVSLGYEVISTGGTSKALKESGVAVIPVSDVTGFPEILDGRVKTLHPKIHGGLLAKRDNKEHVETLKEHNIAPIDIVVINLYPFEKTIAKPNVSFDEAIENIDIGGPTMIRSAAKNHESICVVVEPSDYDSVIVELKKTNNKPTKEFKKQLAQKAFSHTARYDSLISGYLKDADNENSLPETICPILTKESDLRYGENPHQKASFYSLANEKGLPDLEQLNGKELSYNNIIDIEAAWRISKEFEIPAAVIIKHNNPCGAAIGDSLKEAFEKAWAGDPISAFGSIVGINRAVDLATAEAISQYFVEVIVAPDFDSEALELLTKKKALRLIKLADYFMDLPELGLRHVPGGILVQSQDTKKVVAAELDQITSEKPTQKQINDLLFAFAMVKHVKSNAILIAKDGQVLGVGAGQMSRVEAVEIAIKKAGENIKGAVLASDAFFPFKDSVEFAIEAGVTAFIQPGGSKRDQESIDVCNDNNIPMVYTGVRHFKH